MVKQKKPNQVKKTVSGPVEIIKKIKLSTTSEIILAVLIGIIFVFCLVFYLEKRKTQFVPREYLIQKGENITHPDSTPNTIYFPTLSQIIPVSLGQIKDNRWYVSADSATFLTSSASPGQNGNIVIYGHNKKSILGDLKNLKVGDNITVETKDRILYPYQVETIKIVSPEDVYISQPTKSEILTLYTCSGLLDSKRLVVQATPRKFN